MASVTRSIHVWGYYGLLVGLTLALIPNLFLGVLAIPPVDEPWIRILGVAAIAIGINYLGAVRGGVTREFATASVLARAIVTVGIVLAAVRWGYWGLLPVAAVELGGAVWTRTALHRAGRDRTSAPPRT